MKSATQKDQQAKILFLGLDGSGKSTIMAKLHDFKVVNLSMLER